MSMIYQPKGKALEYSDLALNLYTGCSHGCHYCYAPLALHKDRIEFHADVKPRKNIINKLEKEAPKHRGKEVFLCFSCDPYGPELDTTVTREAIRILRNSNIGVNILTKGGLRLLRDIDLLQPNSNYSPYKVGDYTPCKVGATLTFMDMQHSLTWEPHAAVPSQRLEMLRIAHESGISTWASLEPVIDPKQTLELIRKSAPFVDHYKVGRWNYDKRANEIDWAKFLREVTALLESLGKDYYIKKDLAVFSEGGME